MDLVWLQTGHADRSAVATSLATLRREVRAEPSVPVINSEVCYEGIAGGSNATLQRYLFYSHLPVRAAGHSYGAQDLWAFRDAADDGPGAAWGDADRHEAFALPGAAQLGIGAELLHALPWSDLRPAPKAVRPHATDTDPFRPFAATAPGVLLAYFPSASLMDEGIGITTAYKRVSLHGLREGRWLVELINPRTGYRSACYEAVLDEAGDWSLSPGSFASSFPSFEDWPILARTIGRAGD